MNDPIHVGILGATGRMGRLLLKACIAEPELQLVVAATRESSAQLGDDSGLLVGGEANGVFISASSAGLYDLCDVVIDFSLPDGLDVALDQRLAAEVTSKMVEPNLCLGLHAHHNAEAAADLTQH